MTEQLSTPRQTRLEPLSLAWRFLAGPPTLLLFVGLLALALILGALIPQIPARLAEEPEAWLAVQPGILGQRTGLVHALRLFDLYHSLWFRLLLALTGMTLFVRLIESAGWAWRSAIPQRWAPADLILWEKHAHQVRLSSSSSVHQTLVKLRDAFTEAGYRWADLPGLPHPGLMVGRRHLSLWAEPAVYGAFLVALLCLAILSSLGWEGPDWVPASGESRVVGHDTVYSVRLDSFELYRDEMARLRDYRSKITWLADGVEIAQDVAGVGRPAALKGVAVRQAGYVPAVTMRGRDDAGRLLAFQAEGEDLDASFEIEIPFATPDARQPILVLGHDRFLVLTFEALCAVGKPALHLDLLREDGVAGQDTAILYDSGIVNLGGLDVEVELDYRPVLRMDYRPAMGLVLAGMAVAVAALAVGWLASPRLLWVVVGLRDDGTALVRILTLAAAQGNRWLSQLVDSLREALADGA